MLSRIQRSLGIATAALSLMASAADAHEWYSGLNQPGKNVSCCSDRDCQPVAGCLLSGKEGVEIEGQCRPIEYDKVLGVSSPDGERHACWNHIGGQANVLCLILPGSS